MHIGSDYDGVISSFLDGVNRFLSICGHNVKIPANNTEYHFWRKHLGWTDEQFYDFWKKGVRAGIIFASAPYPGAVKAINAMYDAGHQIHIITHRGFHDEPGLAEELTAKVLERDGIKYHSLTFSGDKTVIKTDMMADDMPNNYHALKAAGTDAYLVTRPWNKGLAGYQRVCSLSDFSRRVLAIS